MIIYNLTPNADVENKATDRLINNIYSYKSPLKNITENFSKNRFNIKDYKINKNNFSYEYKITKENVDFYFLCADNHESVATNELNITWDKATISKTNDYIILNETTDYHQIELKNHYFLSLRVDRRGNALFPLSSMIELQNKLDKNEEIYTQILFKPCNPFWYKESDDCIKQFKKNNYVKPKGGFNIEDIVVKTGYEALKIAHETQYALSYFLSTDKEYKFEFDEEYINVNAINLVRNGLSENTNKKTETNGFITEIRFLLNNMDEGKKENIKRCILNAFNDMAEDNEFKTKKIKAKDKSFYIDLFVSREFDNTRFVDDILCSRELGQMIQLPTKHYQNSFKMNAINGIEIDANEDLLKGKVPMGSIMYRGKRKQVNWYDYDLDKFMLPKTWQGFSRSGKTTGMKNFIIDTSNLGYFNLVIDVNEGDLVDDAVSFISNKIPNEKIIVLDFGKEENIYKLGLTEFLSNTSSENIDRHAGKISDVMGYLLDTIVTREPLSDRMKRYFNSAVRLCLVNELSGLNDVRKCLEDHVFRDELISKSKGKVRDKIIEDMKAINKTDSKGKVVDTRFDIVGGIIDRMSILMQNDFLEDTFMNTPNPSIDFYKWFNEGCFVGIKAPKGELGLETVNVLVTFIVLKAWASLLMRHSMNKEDRNPGFITLDEPHSFPYVCEILTGAIRESAKYRGGFNFAVHDLKDLGVLLPKLTSAGSNFIVFNTDEKNLKEIENIIKPFDIETALKLKQHHAIHSLVYGDGRIVQDIEVLPRPQDRFYKVHRKLVDCYREQ